MLIQYSERTTISSSWYQGPQPKRSLILLNNVNSKERKAWDSCLKGLTWKPHYVGSFMSLFVRKLSANTRHMRVITASPWLHQSWPEINGSDRRLRSLSQCWRVCHSIIPTNSEKQSFSNECKNSLNSPLNNFSLAVWRYIQKKRCVQSNKKSDFTKH